VKNLSLVLNIVLIIAVGVLYYFQFSGKTSEVEEPSMLEETEYTVAYINSDSVLKNYEYFDVLQSELQEKSQKMEADYKNRAQGLQRELSDYQRNINNLTIGQAKALEEDLVKKQQNLRVYQESLGQELMKEESRISRQLYDSVTSFLKKYSERNNLHLVVKYNQGSDVLYASDSMNITNAVINGLNNSYAGSEGGSTETNVSDSTSNN